MKFSQFSLFLFEGNIAIESKLQNIRLKDIRHSSLCEYWYLNEFLRTEISKKGEV